jgi:hypothetical protein
MIGSQRAALLVGRFSLLLATAASKNHLRRDDSPKETEIVSIEQRRWTAVTDDVDEEMDHDVVIDAYSIVPATLVQELPDDIRLPFS